MENNEKKMTYEKPVIEVVKIESSDVMIGDSSTLNNDLMGLNADNWFND